MSTTIAILLLLLQFISRELCMNEVSENSVHNHNVYNQNIMFFKLNIFILISRP